MEKVYQHEKYEEKIYKEWEKGKAFEPKGLGRPFCIVMPPPNANDPLHVGHAMFLSIEDILIRYHRMLGDDTLWLPGTDHAGIETQYVFEKKLQKEGKSRFNFDRKTLYQMIWDYVQANSATAIEQMKHLGASADWSRLKFTLDPEIVDLVLSTFEKMFKEGLIYKDLRLVNYCTKCGTGYSELEVIHREQVDPLYYIKYGPFTLATVRPETKFGDTALAVNPKDKRYSDWIGKEIEAEGLLGKFRIKVVADDYVDPEFGTGVVKITPAHDLNDFEVGKKHSLPIKQVIDFDGKMMANTGPYAGMKVLAARRLVVEDLHKRGLVEKIDEKYSHNVATCYRCGAILEPLPRPQLFIKVSDLAKKALKALNNKDILILGAGREKILKHWLLNLHDWNISRQIAWGIRIPLWYDIGKYKEVEIGFLTSDKKFVKGLAGDLMSQYTFEEIEAGLQTLNAPLSAQPTNSRTKPAKYALQDTDTFDTWFSSGQWPIVTLLAQSGETRNQKPETGKTIKVNKTTDDYERFYPTSVMETGYDILPIWVMRMILMGFYLTGKPPFKKVYLHGLVRDEKGQKMSKSKGNVMNPLLLVDKYGADALRMALVMSTTAGQDSAVGENKVRGMRNFSNKVWNAARFIKMNREELVSSSQKPVEDDISNDKEDRKKLVQITLRVTKQLDDLKIGQAAETVHNEFWHWWCDEVLESAKTPHYAHSTTLRATRGRQASLKFLEEGMKIWLRLLHPFMPFVTEAAWSELGYEGLLVEREWPS